LIRKKSEPPRGERELDAEGRKWRGENWPQSFDECQKKVSFFKLKAGEREWRKSNERGYEKSRERKSSCQIARKKETDRAGKGKRKKTSLRNLLTRVLKYVFIDSSTREFFYSLFELAEGRKGRRELPNGNTRFFALWLAGGEKQQQLMRIKEKTQLARHKEGKRKRLA